jgi:predicted dehydrogenase/nucleoside-diphosphate-sugar epimerase
MVQMQHTSSVQAPGPTPRFLILGGGAVVAEFHVPGLLQMRWAEGAMIVEPSPRSVAILRSRYPGLAVLQSDYRSALEDPSLRSRFDGVLVALPNHLHEDAVRRSLEGGFDVLCEKPLALTSEACRRLAATAGQSGRRIAVGMVRRLLPNASAIRSALADNLIGELLSIDIEDGNSYRWPVASGSHFRKEDGGLLVNMGIHYLDMIESWVGPLTPVQYEDDWAGGAEANFDYRLRTGSGAAVRVAVSCTHELQNRILLTGTRGRLQAPVNFGPCQWQSEAAGLRAELTPAQPFRSGDWPVGFAPLFSEQFFEFAQVIRGNEEPRVNAYQAAATQEVVDWAYRNRRPIYSAPGWKRSFDRPELEPAPVVVTGGTGFVGGRLVERLNELGFGEIRIPIRSYRSGANVGRFPVQRVLTDLLNYESVKSVVRGARYVFHLAYGSGGADAGRVTVEGTRNVVEAAIESGAECVVVVSTATVFGHPKTAQPIDETFPYRPALGEYGRSKAKAEKYCLGRARSSRQTRIVVLNPSAIYGPGGPLFTELPVRAAADGHFCWFEEGNSKLNYVYADNVVDALLLAAQCREAHGERFIISDGVCAVRDFLAPILGARGAMLPSYTREQLRAMHKSARPGLRDLFRALTGEEMMRVINGLPVVSTLKRWLERRLADFYRSAQQLRQSAHVEAPARQAPGARPLPPLWLADIFAPPPVEFSAAKARRVLGWRSCAGLSEGQQASIAWLRRLGLLDGPEVSEICETADRAVM